MQIENKIVSECLNKLNSLRLENNAYYSFVRIVNEILAEINNLRSVSIDEDEKRKLFGIYSAISHTLGKEVEYIKYKEDEMKKKNAAKVRKKEHYELVSKACEMINLDLLAF
jgi:hypothetical protein